MSTEGRREVVDDRRKQRDRRNAAWEKEKATLIDDLTMQMKSRVAANRTMKTEPTDEKKTIEYRAIQFLKTRI